MGDESDPKTTYEAAASDFNALAKMRGFTGVPESLVDNSGRPIRCRGEDIKMAIFTLRSWAQETCSRTSSTAPPPRHLGADRGGANRGTRRGERPRG